jgi:two-component system chemotaxis response regulator CheB
MRRELPADFSFIAETVAIGASAGGISALFLLLEELQPPLDAAIIVVLHLPEDRDSLVVQVLGHRTRVPVQEAQPHGPVQPGIVYIAPPGYHLLVERDRSFSLSCDPPVTFSRPSIDVLFESCAEAYGASLLAMVLTGANEDGARGLRVVKSLGGLTAVQDPEGAAHALMPEAAVRLAQPEFVLPLAGLRSLLQTVVHR